MYRSLNYSMTIRFTPRNRSFGSIRFNSMKMNAFSLTVKSVYLQSSGQFAGQTSLSTVSRSPPHAVVQYGSPRIAVATPSDNKKAVLPQGNRAMPQVFFSVEVRQQHSLQA